MPAEHVRVIFMGTSAFAVPSLHALFEAGFDLVGAVSQPARPAGRGRQLVATPVAEAAARLGLRLLTPERLRTPESVAEIAELAPDLIVVAAYAQILPKSILDMPAHGCANVHASLLPRWRGASPIHAAILHGDEFSGVSIMLMEPSMDTGPVLGQTMTRVDETDTTPVLEERLARAGAALLSSILPGYLDGSIKPVAQDASLVTYAPVIKKEDGLINWLKPAQSIWRASRAYERWPVAHTYWNGRMLKLLKCAPEALPSGPSGPPGTVLALSGGKGAGVVTGAGLLRLEEVSPEGSRRMTISEFMAGHRSFVGSRLGAKDGQG